MPTAEEIWRAIQQSTDQQSFIRLLRETLGWEIPQEVGEVEDIAYAWSADDLHAEGLDKKIVDGQVWQIQPLRSDAAQPWGIFVLEFKHADAFMMGRGLAGPLRKILRGLVPKRRGQQANLKTWDRENLLFICTHEYRHFRFAYFKAPRQKEKTSPLAQFGWNYGDSDIRTLCEHNLPHLCWRDDDAELAHWREAFSVEKVTKAFYHEYASAFEKVENAIGKNNRISEDDLRLFTQTLFNRLMFLRFIEKKGWLRFNGDTSYLAALYAGGGIKKKSFYQSRLQPLFFEALAIEGEQKSEAVGDVVFLNGGLFEKTDLDEKVVDIPDEAFQAILDREGLFYRFNFTVQESTPLDIEVAVDPEMLGKVFEELVTGRHETGSYYTPRPVVAFMCREAIKGFLTAKTSAPQEAITKLVDEQEIAEDLTDKHAEEILFYLETIKAVDPACGSGAYLLGLLQELISVRRTLQNPKLGSNRGFLFQLKLRLISQCLYGVDIDPFATNIAKLRLWLSLAVEAETAQPLPNLDFKIETGNSILGPCDPLADRDDALVIAALKKRAEQLVLKKDRFMLAHGEEKATLFNKIKAEEAAIAKETSTVVGEAVIVWHVHFAEVFITSRRKITLDAYEQKSVRIDVLEPSAFDIVLANPPYGISTSCRHAVSVANKDSYACFIGLARELTAGVGYSTYIVPTSWETGERFTKFRRWLLKDSAIFSVVNLPYDVFDIPYVDTCILSFGGRRTCDCDTIQVASLPKREEGGLEEIKSHLQDLELRYVTADPDLRLILEPHAAELIARLAEEPNVGDLFPIKRGIEAYGYTISETRRSQKWHPFFSGQVYRYVLGHGRQAYVKPQQQDCPWGTGKRLLLRRIVSRRNRLMTTYAEDDFIVKKDLYVIRPSEVTDEAQILYLLGLLNSSLFSYLYLTRSAAAQKDDYRQVSIAGIRGLPYIFGKTLAS